MKHLVPFLLAFLLFSCNERGYKITGKVSSDALNGKTVYLKKIVSGQTLDSASVNNNSFTFKGNIDYPTLAFLSAQGVNFRTILCVENANIQLSIDAEDYSKSFASGSTLNDLYTSKYLPIIKSVEKKFNDLNTYVQQQGGEPDYTEIQEKQNQILEELSDSLLIFIEKNPGNIVTALALTNVMDKVSVEKIQEIFDGLDDHARQDEIGEYIKKGIERKLSPEVEVGQKYRDMTMKTPEGNDISISDYAGKGKYVLLDFWASWCGPCRQENPNVVALYEKYKDKGFEIVGISFDENKEQWIKGIADDKITWVQMSDLKGWNSEATVKYRINSIPATILLDSEGTVIDTGLRGETLANRLKEIFPE
ncbi:MAG: AhpC/TSA family protein [Prevotellaceae bacterium]|jgi:thiol-disulfide isomerase/thioredoxin|nr:AhpC/TSA family protein [Prevotellaceae bacterium]